MPRRELLAYFSRGRLLTDHQRAALSEPATDERTMVRFYTLTAEDRSCSIAGAAIQTAWGSLFYSVTYVSRAGS
jgi:hypothetical protein